MISTIALVAVLQAKVLVALSLAEATALLHSELVVVSQADHQVSARLVKEAANASIPGLHCNEGDCSNE